MKERSLTGYAIPNAEILVVISHDNAFQARIMSPGVQANQGQFEQKYDDELIKIEETVGFSPSASNFVIT